MFSIDQCRWKRVEGRSSLRIETPKTNEHAGFGTGGRNGAASGSRLLPGGADRPLLSLRRGPGSDALPEGLPQFILVGYVDGQLFVQYDSNTKRMESQVPWMKKEVVEKDPQYWEWNTRNFRNAEETFRVSVENVRNYYNLSKGEWKAASSHGLPPYTP
ncbi:hypothetical protein JRQ81_000002 [Phrynocephalus forsythii]|uniref:MHC class I-like antigen recognition-like domain-containing protein n=1 Tax=Phrynocephalus forsythii TaxID=171643 RepID=A0A9Q0X558_9SAUR|nr:hypothetical protein JRQ81_000002 [Phrynocephalus forsythii]